MRYAWLPEIDGRGHGRALGPARAVLRVLDRRTVARVTEFAANSTAVAARIGAFYEREAIVIHPPVEVDRFSVESTVGRSETLLGFSRWVPYKRLDLVIDVGERLRMPVVIAGCGPDEPRLVRRAEEAKVPVQFVRSPSHPELVHLYRSCAALVFPAEEDFGIVPVEAQACGTTVVALGRGGALDTVIDGSSGVLAREQSVEALAEATQAALALGDRTAACRASAERFSSDVFDRRFRAWVDGALAGPST